MTKATWDETDRRYIAWDTEKMSHITRQGVSEANAIARVKVAHLNAEKSRGRLKKKIAYRRIAIATARKAHMRTFEEIAKEIDAEIKAMER